jgi:aspartate racemase
MYPGKLAEAGIETVRPHEEDRAFIDHTIYNELSLGQVSPETRQRYLDVCARHIESDSVDSVILGCTEIPLVISEGDLPVSVLDTTRIHAAAILAAAS